MHHGAPSAGTFATERLANRAWQRAEAQLAAGRVTDPRRGRQTLRSYVENEWFPNHVMEATTREGYRYTLDRYVLPMHRDLRMSDVLPNEVREWVAPPQHEHGMRPPTIVKCKVVPDPEILGWTEPNDKGRSYRHGHGPRPGPVPVPPLPRRGCRLSRGQAQGGKDHPRKPRTVQTDGHIGRGWFRTNVWLTAVAASDLGFHVSPHGLRHAHASWLIAGGADLQVVKERSRHASITTTEKYLHTLPDVADQSILDALAAVRPTTPPAVLAEPALTDDRDRELADLRQVVAQFRQIFESLTNPETDAARAPATSS